jgi:inorganic triphosphatase YgiF
MAHWKTKLEIQEEWEKRENDEITNQQLGKAIAAKLKVNRFFKKDEDLQEIAEDFEQIEETADDEYFNDVMQRLYDYGDSGHRIWVGTF